MNSPDQTVRDLVREWELTPDGDPLPGRRASVRPVRTPDGVAAVLKVGDPTRSSEHEPLALQHWHGVGAVRLLRADPHRRALLLERLAGPDLADHWDVRACEIVGSLYGRLHVPAPPQLTALTTYVERAAAPLAALPRDAPLPRRLVEQAGALVRDLCADPGEPRLLHTRLHYAHVLAAGGAPDSPDSPDSRPGAPEDWRAIAPRPLAGDPHYEVAPLLLHRFDELAGRVREGLRDRFFAVVDAAGLDEDRARGWVVVRTVLSALADLSDADRVTRSVTIAKAMDQ